MTQSRRRLSIVSFVMIFTMVSALFLGFSPAPAYAADGEWSAQAITNNDRETSDAPALAAYGGKLYKVWRGAGKDSRIWYSAYNGLTWSQPQLTTAGGTSHAPAIAVYKNKLYMVWKGVDSDPRIFYSTFDGGIWSSQKVTNAGGTSNAPALAVYNNHLCMVWKGTGSDSRIFYSTFDGNTWFPQRVTTAGGTSDSPAVAANGDNLCMVWKGTGSDYRIFYSTFDGTTWAPQQVTTAGGTSHAPALARYNGLLYMAWKGTGSDARIFSSTFNGSTWSGQQLTKSDRGTSNAPALAEYGGNLVMAWKGVSGDAKIWFSTLNIPYSPPGFGSGNSLVSKITLYKTTTTLAPGVTENLNATILPDDAKNKTLTWTSSNNAVATVDASGLVKAVAPGTATIIAQAKDGSDVKSLPCTVTVVATTVPVTNLTLDITALTLCNLFGSHPLTAKILPSNATNKNIIWTSNNRNVADVDGNGKIIHKNAGTATITAMAADGSGKKAQCIVEMTVK